MSKNQSKNVVLSEDDIRDLATNGLAAALGITAVSPEEKLTTAWGEIKVKD